MDSKSCSICKIEKHIKIFCKNYAECKDCNDRRGLKRYYENKGKISNHRKIYSEKSKDKLLQQQNDRYIPVKELVRSYV